MASRKRQEPVVDAAETEASVAAAAAAAVAAATDVAATAAAAAAAAAQQQQQQQQQHAPPPPAVHIVTSVHGGGAMGGASGGAGGSSSSSSAGGVGGVSKAQRDIPPMPESVRVRFTFRQHSRLNIGQAEFFTPVPAPSTESEEDAANTVADSYARLVAGVQEGWRSLVATKDEAWLQLKCELQDPPVIYGRPSSRARVQSASLITPENWYTFANTIWANSMRYRSKALTQQEVESRFAVELFAMCPRGDGVLKRKRVDPPAGLPTAHLDHGHHQPPPQQHAAQPQPQAQQQQHQPHQQDQLVQMHENQDVTLPVFRLSYDQGGALQITMSRGELRRLLDLNVLQEGVDGEPATDDSLVTVSIITNQEQPVTEQQQNDTYG